MSGSTATSNQAGLRQLGSGLALPLSESPQGTKTVILPKELAAIRFSEDLRRLDLLRQDPHVAPSLISNATDHFRASRRTRLLASALRVDEKLIPGLAKSFETLRNAAKVEEPMEAYVFEDSSINAFVTAARQHILVGLSSGAVNHLSHAELGFVLGHEFGHVLFHHIDVNIASGLDERAGLPPRTCLHMLAWQRASEISADRCGLLCCNSLETAATALFKSLSGLRLPGVVISPADFARQWDELTEEVIERGGVEDWQLTHPFAPLRVKAMMLFHDACGKDLSTLRSGAEYCFSEEVDREVAKQLSLIDPLARDLTDSADPLLVDFFLWGGLYIAVADGEFHESEKARVASLVPEQRLREVLDAQAVDRSNCLDRFRSAFRARHRKMRSVEVHRVLNGLMSIAVADGRFDALEVEAFRELAQELGIGERACDLLIEDFVQKGRPS